MTRSFPMLLQFLAVAVLILGLAIWFTAGHLSSGLAPDSPWRPAVWAACAAVWTFPLTRIFARGAKPNGLTEGAGFFMLGLGATLFMALLGMDLAALLLRLTPWTLPAWTPLALGGACVVLCLAGLRYALRGPLVKRVRVPHADLHPGLQGLRIVQISDLHVSSLLGADYVAGLVKQVNDLEPHLIAITGDLVDGPVVHLAGAIRPLGLLQAPLGVHYVTGNHEYFWNAPQWTALLAGLGFEVLENGHRVVEHAGGRLKVVGINDPTAERFDKGQGPDAAKAVEGSGSADFTLFLSHQPSQWRQAEIAGSDLMLAGHTHAGQFFPFQSLVSLFHRYFKGLYRHEGRFWIYVNPGAGFWGPPNRLGVPTEITLLELAPA